MKRRKKASRVKRKDFKRHDGAWQRRKTAALEEEECIRVNARLCGLDLQVSEVTSGRTSCTTGRPVDGVGCLMGVNAWRLTRMTLCTWLDWPLESDPFTPAVLLEDHERA